MIKKVSKWLSANRHAYAMLFFIFYLVVFFTLEHWNRPEHIIRFFLDDYIPFNEYFIIPYFMWFLCLAASLVGFMVYEKETFLNLCLMMFGGMTFCLIIYAVIPSGLDIRGKIAENNLCCQLTNWLYSIDTPTNVCPSIHVASSVSIAFAVWKSKKLKSHPKFQFGTIALLILICVSTVFIKQHSLIDVFCGILLSTVLYYVAYRTNWKNIMVWTKHQLVLRRRRLHTNSYRRWKL